MKPLIIRNRMSVQVLHNFRGGTVIALGTKGIQAITPGELLDGDPRYGLMAYISRVDKPPINSVANRRALYSLNGDRCMIIGTFFSQSAAYQALQLLTHAVARAAYSKEFHAADNLAPSPAPDAVWLASKVIDLSKLSQEGRAEHTAAAGDGRELRVIDLPVDPVIAVATNPS